MIKLTLENGKQMFPAFILIMCIDGCDPGLPTMQPYDTLEGCRSAALAMVEHSAAKRIDVYCYDTKQETTVFADSRGD